MPSRSISDLHPLLAYAFGKAEAEFLLTYPEAPKPFISCTFRSPEEQTALFNQPTDKIDNNKNGKIDEPAERVTNARAGESAHNYKPALAFDVAFLAKGGRVDWADKCFDLFAPLVLKSTGITWGGNFKSLPDRPHFELTGWKKLAGK